MERKGGSGTAVMEAEEVRSALSRTRGLSVEEERVLRMRHGAGEKDLRAPLPKAAGGNAELADELLLMELELMRSLRARQAAARPARAAEPAQSRVKDKIVRALRKKR